MASRCSKIKCGHYISGREHAATAVRAKAGDGWHPCYNKRLVALSGTRCRKLNLSLIRSGLSTCGSLFSRSPMVSFQYVLHPLLFLWLTSDKDAIVSITPGAAAH